MSDYATTKEVKERELAKLCMDLPGTRLGFRRGAVMSISESFSHPALLCLALACLLVSVPPLHAAPSSSATNAFIPQPLSIADAVNLALGRNPNILRAQKDLEGAQGVIIQTRAIAIPKVNLGGSFAAAQPSDVDTFNTPSFTFGPDPNWGSQIQPGQSGSDERRQLRRRPAERRGHIQYSLFHVWPRPELGYADQAGAIPLRRWAYPLVTPCRPPDQGALHARLPNCGGQYRRRSANRLLRCVARRAANHRPGGVG